MNDCQASGRKLLTVLAVLAALGWGAVAHADDPEDGVPPPELDLPLPEETPGYELDLPELPDDAELGEQDEGDGEEVREIEAQPGDVGDASPEGEPSGEPAVTAEAAPAGEQMIKLAAHLGQGYDSNILLLSGRQQACLAQGPTHPCFRTADRNLYRVYSEGDSVTTVGLSAALDKEVLPGGILHGELRYAHQAYAINYLRSVHRVGLTVRQGLDLLKAPLGLSHVALDYRLTPFIYRQQMPVYDPSQAAPTPIDVAMERPLINDLGFTLGQALPAETRVRLGYVMHHESHDKPLGHLSGLGHGFMIDAAGNPLGAADPSLGFIGLRLGYSLVAFGAAGDDPATAWTEADRSHLKHRILGSLWLDLSRLEEIPLRIGVAGEIDLRRYTTSAEDDIVHYGRSDAGGSLLLHLDADLPFDLTARAYYEYAMNDATFGHVLPTGVEPAETTDYVVHRSGLSVSYRFLGLGGPVSAAAGAP